MEIARQKILLVEDEELQRKTLEISLRGPGRSFTYAQDGDEAIDLAARETPDVIVTDYHMPRMDGLELVRHIRRNPFTAHIPVIMVTGESDKQQRVALIRAGADDVVLKPFDPEELAARVDMIAARCYRELSTDSLTRLPGNEPTRDQIRRRVVGGHPFVIAYLDVDRFKSFVDRYGYDRASRCIASLARLIERVVRELGRPSDFVGHIGGDDFVVLVEPDHARRICERILELFAERVPTFYDEEDRARGYITARDRDGAERTFPLIGLSAVLISNAETGMIDVPALAELVARLKLEAKVQGGSRIVEYRREG